MARKRMSILLNSTANERALKRIRLAKTAEESDKHLRDKNAYEVQKYRSQERRDYNASCKVPNLSGPAHHFGLPRYFEYHRSLKKVIGVFAIKNIIQHE